MDREKRKKISTKELMSLDDVAVACGTTKEMVAEWVAQGNIRRFETPQSSGLVRYSDIVDYMRKHSISARECDQGKVGSNVKGVLVVDDDAMVRGMIAQVLTPFCNLYQAASGYEALKIVADREEVGLVLLDIRMPGQSGGEAYEHIKTIRPDLKIVIVSGYIEDVPDSMMADGNVLGVIEKPVGEDVLVDTVARALDEGFSI